MNWFKRMIVRWVKEDWENASQIKEDTYSNLARAHVTRVPSAINSSSSLDSDASLTFSVYNAIGGKVVEFRRYDRKNDRSDHCVYVIGKDEDFGEKIAKIATLETIKG